MQYKPPCSDATSPLANEICPAKDTNETTNKTTSNQAKTSYTTTKNMTSKSYISTLAGHETQDMDIDWTVSQQKALDTTHTTEEDRSSYVQSGI